MKYKVTLNNRVYEVEVEKGEAILSDEYDAMAPAPAVPVAAPAAAAAPAPAAPSVSVAAGEPITAPLPGNIIDIKVSQGEAVKAGQLLLLIEAMKMENEVVAPKDGTVAQIVCSKGAAVNTGDTLLVIS